MLNKTLNGLRNNEKMAKIFIILLSLLISDVLFFKVRLGAFVIQRTDSADFTGLVILLLPGLILALMHYMIFKKVKGAILFFFLGIILWILMVNTIYYF